jgi:branched-chain amino acid transport system permease protein
MEQFIVALVAGIGAGGLYAILGVGLVVAFRGSGVINFAHGAVAAYAAYTFHELRQTGDIYMPWFDPIPEFGFLKSLNINNIPVRISLTDANPSPWLLVIVSLLMAALIGLLMHLLVFRPLRNAPALGKVIGSVGVMLYLNSVMTLNYGPTNRADSGFWGFRSDSGPISVLNGTVPRSSFYLAAAAIVITALVWALFTFTRFGLATRAADENEKGASLLGYSPQLLAGLNWVLSSVLAGAAGIVFLHKTQPSLFVLFVVPALGAALFGNLSSMIGAAAGGLLIGVIASGGVQIASNSWWPDWLPAEGVRNLVPLMVIILVLYFRGKKLPVRGSIGIGKQPSAPRSNNAILGAFIAVFFAVMLSNIFTSNWESTLTTTLISILFMFSLVVLVGFLGQISLVQWTLAGVAAMFMARLSADGTKIRPSDFFVNSGPGWPDPLAALGGVLLAVVIGLVLAIPALRIRGVQLAVVTLSAVIAVEQLITRNAPLMGEGAVSTNPMPQPYWFGQYVGAQNPVTFRTDYWKFTVFIIVAVVLVGLAVANLRRGATGRRFLAVRSNERAAASSGINVARTKLLGFGISSAIAGLAGVSLGYKLPAVGYENFSVFAGLALLAFVYLGGITTTWGAIIGGCLVAGGLMPEFLHLHFKGVQVAYINLFGAIGLIINAIVTGGAGIALLQRNQGMHVLHALRRPSAAAASDGDGAGSATKASPAEVGA